MADEKTQSTKITFTDPERTGKPVTVAGVQLMPGEAADLADFMDEDRAKEIASSFTQNSYFHVEGGPDHAALNEERDARARQHAEQVQDAIERQEDKRILGGNEPLPPETYEAPNENKLVGASTTKKGK